MSVAVTEISPRRLVERQATLLAPVLRDALATAIVDGAQRCSGLIRTKYPHFLPLAVRIEMREALERELLPAGWKLGGDSRAMGQLLLEEPELGLVMRFLKERRGTYPGGVPAAGTTSARRKAWTADQLDGLQLPITTGESLNLLLLWDFVNQTESDEFSLRIAHTLAPGRHGSAVPCDMLYEVKNDGSIFEHRAFRGSQESEDFFAEQVHIDELEL